MTRRELSSKGCPAGFRYHRYKWGEKCVRCGAPKLESTRITEDARRRRGR